MNYEKEKKHTDILKRVLFSILTLSFVMQNISGSVRFRNKVGRIKAHGFSYFGCILSRQIRGCKWYQCSSPQGIQTKLWMLWSSTTLRTMKETKLALLKKRGKHWRIFFDWGSTSYKTLPTILLLHQCKHKVLQSRNNCKCEIWQGS